MLPEQLNLTLAAKSFAAVGSEARLQVLHHLVRAGQPGLSIGQIQQCLQIPLSTLSHHLKFLTDAGLIEQHKQGRAVINRARYDRISALAEYLLNDCCADAGSVREVQA